MRRSYVLLGRLLFIILKPMIRIVIRRTKRVYVCVRMDDKYLLVKNWLARDTWRLPGGGTGRHEQPIDAAIRELYEELGIRVSASQLVYLGETVAQTDHLGFAYTLFMCDVLTQTVHAAVHEITDTQWVDEIPLGYTAELDFARQALLDKR